MELNRENVRICIEEYIRNVLPEQADAITDSVSFSAMGMDSVSHVQLIAAIEDRFNLKIEPTMAFDYPTVAALSQQVAELAKQENLA